MLIPLQFKNDQVSRNVAAESNYLNIAPLSCRRGLKAAPLDFMAQRQVNEQRLIILTEK